MAADRVAPSGPLHGVPFTCKDPFAVAGMRAPNGSKLLADYVSDGGLRAGGDDARGGRDPARQDQRLRVRELVGLGEPAVRRDRQPARPVAHGGRLLGRRGGGDRERDVAARARLRPRRLDPQPVPLRRRCSG